MEGDGREPVAGTALAEVDLLTVRESVDMILLGEAIGQGNRIKEKVDG